MFELALRAKELASSNLSSLIDLASNPAKMLKLLMAELEESVIALTREASAMERAAGKFTQDAEQREAAALSWEDKAKLALARGREDLALGALAERNASHEAAKTPHEAASAAHHSAAELRSCVSQLEAKHGETRTQLLRVLAKMAPTRVAATDAARARTGALLDRFAGLEKRIDYATRNAAAPATLDQELAALANDATLEADLAALRKAARKQRN